MFQPGREEECQGFKEDCRLNLGTLGLITHTTISIWLRERKVDCVDIQKLYLRIILTSNGQNSRNYWNMRGNR